MTVAAFIAGFVFGTFFGFIVCAVLSYDTIQGEMYDDYYIQEIQEDDLQARLD